MKSLQNQFEEVRVRIKNKIDFVRLSPDQSILYISYDKSNFRRSGLSYFEARRQEEGFGTIDFFRIEAHGNSPQIRYNLVPDTKLDNALNHFRNAEFWFVQSGDCNTLVIESNNPPQTNYYLVDPDSKQLVELFQNLNSYKFRMVNQPNLMFINEGFRLGVLDFGRMATVIDCTANSSQLTAFLEDLFNPKDEGAGTVWGLYYCAFWDFGSQNECLRVIEQVKTGSSFWANRSQKLTRGAIK